MASGVIYGTTSNSLITCRIEWTSISYVTENYSNITAILYYTKDASSTEDTYGNGNFGIVCNGNGEIDGKYLRISVGKTVTASIKTFYKINHDANGKKRVTLSATGNIPNTTLTATYCSGEIELDDLSQETTFDSLSCSTNYFNGTFTYKYTPKSPLLYNQCEIGVIKDGVYYTRVKTINIGDKAAVQQSGTVTLSSDELSTIYKQHTDNPKGTLRFTMRTYSNSGYVTAIGSKTKDITLNIPNDETTQPRVVSFELTPSSTLKSPYNTMYLQGLSKVKATTFTYEAKHGATIVSSNITVDGKNYAHPYESDTLTQDKTITVKATVKDSRGFYGTYYKDIEVIPYSKPYLKAYSDESNIIVARCDKSANFTDSGTYLKIKAKVVFSKIILGGVQKNYGKIKFRYRIEGGAYNDWKTIHDSETDSNHSDEVITAPLLGGMLGNGTLDIKSNYQVEVVAYDDLYESAPIAFAVPSDVVYMHRPALGKSMGLGGYAQGDGNLDVYWKTRARGGISLFDAGGGEIPLDTTLPIPRDQVKEGYDPNNLESGVYVVTDKVGLKSGSTTIMANGVLIQMGGTVGGNVKIQLALPVDTNRSPMYRICWYNSWADWRSLKL